MSDIKNRVAFLTLGCKVNQYETNAMEQKFFENGYEIVSFEDKANVYIINTCTVTNISDKKSRQMIRRVKKQNSDAVLVATGCYAQVASDEILKQIPEIDLILGINEKNNIVSFVEKFIKEKNKIMQKSDVMAQREFLDFGNISYTEKTRAVIKVQDGCDRFCTYCIIPYARGRVRSRKIENVVAEVESIVKTGIKEVVITGIHVASYGKDFNDGTTLIDLLEQVNKVQNLERIRLSSIEPIIITEEFVGKLKKINKICNHFHLSLQSGCDDVLKRMNRRYTTSEFKHSTELLRNAYEDVALTTDVIVGFPGETEEEFEQTYQFLKEINFFEMHIFQYSQRKGTKAAQMQGQINPYLKFERSQKLIALSEENELAFLEKQIGKTVKVLFEQTENGYTIGHTTNYLTVGIQGNYALENKIHDVLIEKIDNKMLIGKCI